MTRLFTTIIILLLAVSAFGKDHKQDYIIRKGDLYYDFSFAELALKYLETEDSLYLYQMAELEATEHILNHAKQYQYRVPKDSKLKLVKYLLTPSVGKPEVLEAFQRNLKYAKVEIAGKDLAQKHSLPLLQANFSLSGSLYFTFGYDLGVVYGNNASLNLAHPYFRKNMEELKYYAIHETHHAGFIALKNGYMPSLDISTYKEMAHLIEYLTHLEGMGTLAPLELRMKENAMNIDKDYISLQNDSLMKAYEQEFFEIYYHFKNHPERLVKKEDWAKLAILSDRKRLWYRVGARMADSIDKQLGRNKLTALISESSENFIQTYLQLR